METERISTMLRMDLHRLVRIRAAEEGIPIRDVLDDVVGAGIEVRDKMMGRKAQKSKETK